MGSACDYPGCDETAIGYFENPRNLKYLASCIEHRNILFKMLKRRYQGKIGFQMSLDF